MKGKNRELPRRVATDVWGARTASLTAVENEGGSLTLVADLGRCSNPRGWMSQIPINEPVFAVLAGQIYLLIEKLGR